MQNGSRNGQPLLLSARKTRAALTDHGIVAVFLIEDELMRIALVAALGTNRVIGAEGGLPWRLPDDLRHFKRLTLGRPLLLLVEIDLADGRPADATARVARLDTLTASLAADNTHRLRVGMLLARCRKASGDDAGAVAVADSLAGLVAAAEKPPALLADQIEELREELGGS